MKRQFLPVFIQYFLKLGALLMVMFSGFRWLLLSLHRSQLAEEAEPFLMHALFNRGLLFDASVVSYTIAPVFLLLAIGYFARIKSKRYYKTALGLSFLLSIATLFLCCADLPFYQYYNFRLTKVVLVLSKNDSVWLILRDIFTNPIYLPYTLTFIAGSVVVALVIRKLGKALLQQEVAEKKWQPVVTSLVCVYLIFSGIRGDLNPDAKPLKLEHAYFTDFTFINQLGLNATFSFIDSYRAFQLNYLDDDDAIATAQKLLGITPQFDSPIAREANVGMNGIRPNIVLVLIESLSANKMGLYGNPNNLTPFLDSLAKTSLTFKNTYTAGIHTHNGIYSSLTGLPAIMHNTPMLSAQTSSQGFSGLATTLQQNGYNSIFFATGKRNFDNMQGFLPRNGFHSLISKRNYPQEHWVNRWGVADHAMFDFSIHHLDSLAQQNIPFLATFMTISTHNPYTIPAGIDFQPTTNDPIDRSYQYADWSINKFLNDIKHKAWFNNTLFIFTGDHGQNFDPVYEMPLAYHHTPMIFHYPAVVPAETRKQLALQIDLFPTMMGILQLPYINNTMGVDLLKERRPFAYFSADSRLACLNETHYLIMNKRGKAALYHYPSRSLKNEIDERKALADSMKTYVFSMLQTTQWLIDNRKTGLQQSKTGK